MKIENAAADKHAADKHLNNGSLLSLGKILLHRDSAVRAGGNASLTLDAFVVIDDDAFAILLGDDFDRAHLYAVANSLARIGIDDDPHPETSQIFAPMILV